MALHRRQIRGGLAGLCSQARVRTAAEEKARDAAYPQRCRPVQCRPLCLRVGVRAFIMNCEW